jgi:hypothetical protein
LRFAGGFVAPSGGVGVLEAVRAAKGTLHIQVIGLAIIEADVTPELAATRLPPFTCSGLQAPAAVKAAL